MLSKAMVVRAWTLAGLLVVESGCAGGVAGPDPGYLACMSPDKVYDPADRFVRSYVQDGSGDYSCVDARGVHKAAGR